MYQFLSYLILSYLMWWEHSWETDGMLYHLFGQLDYSSISPISITINNISPNNSCRGRLETQAALNTGHTYIIHDHVSTCGDTLTAGAAGHIGDSWQPGSMSIWAPFQYQDRHSKYSYLHSEDKTPLETLKVVKSTFFWFSSLYQ